MNEPAALVLGKEATRNICIFVLFLGYLLYGLVPTTCVVIAMLFAGTGLFDWASKQVELCEASVRSTSDKQTQVECTRPATEIPDVWYMRTCSPTTKSATPELEKEKIRYINKCILILLVVIILRGFIPTPLIVSVVSLVGSAMLEKVRELAKQRQKSRVSTVDRETQTEDMAQDTTHASGSEPTTSSGSGSPTPTTTDSDDSVDVQEVALEPDLNSNAEENISSNESNSRSSSFNSNKATAGFSNTIPDIWDPDTRDPFNPSNITNSDHPESSSSSSSSNASSSEEDSYAEASLSPSQLVRLQQLRDAVLAGRPDLITDHPEIARGTFSTILDRNGKSAVKLLLHDRLPSEPLATWLQRIARNQTAFELEGEVMDLLCTFRNKGHPSIVTMYRVGLGESKEQTFFTRPHIYMELATCSMASHTQSNGPITDRATALAYLRALMLGLERMLVKGVLHRDIKPANILYFAANAQDDGTAAAYKIADFSTAVRARETNTSDEGGMVGSPSYMAPEAAFKGRYGWESDLYAAYMTWLEGRKVLEVEVGEVTEEGMRERHLRVSSVGQGAPDEMFGDAFADLGAERAERRPSVMQVIQRIDGLVGDMGKDE